MNQPWRVRALILALLVLPGCPGGSTGTTPEARVQANLWRVYPSELRISLAREGAAWRFEIPPQEGVLEATGSFDGKRLLLSVQASTSQGVLTRAYDGELEAPSLIQGQVRHQLNGATLITEKFLAHPLSAD